MKRITTLLSLFMLIVMQAAAQASISVAGFQRLDNDNTGTIDSRDDDNGIRCALIKVHVPMKGFSFDAGDFFIADQKELPGEIWLWVTPNLPNIKIRHESLGSYVYEFETRVEPSKTYEMLLDVGFGSFVTINPSRDGSDVELDGQYVGKSPVVNLHITNGEHTIKAVNGKWEAQKTIVLSSQSEKRLRIDMQMEDLSYLYGSVTVKADDPRTEIVYAGRTVGTGQWVTELREGTYTISAQLADCDPSKTEFTVVRGKDNEVTANAPIPHTGYLSLYTRPRNLTAIIDGHKTVDDLTERQLLPVGRHQVEFMKKGYVSQQHEYDIVRYETTADTVTLDRIKYVKDLAFYFGGGYTLSSMGGISAIAGAVIKNHDVQLSYTFGMGKSDQIHWYGNNGSWLSTTQYKQNLLALRYGYQFNLMQLLAITPQVGFGLSSLSASVLNGNGNYGDGASAKVASLGVKLLLVPIHHLYVFAAPQYAVTVGKSSNFQMLADYSNVKVDGFSATLGVLFNF